MEKINLCMPVGKWLSMHIRKGAMGWTEFKVAVFGGFDDFSMSLLCKSTESEMLQISDLDENVLAAYSDALEEAHKEAEAIFATFHQRLNEVLASDWWDEETMEIFHEYPDRIVVIDRKSNEIIKTYGKGMEIDRTVEYIKHE